jgi:hypothetical protein
VALERIQKDGFDYIKKAAPGQAAPALLGRSELCDKVGAHYFGFDDSFESPTIFSVYYDPDDPESRIPRQQPLWYVGYMQFVQVRFRGIPVPPQDCGGVIADRAPYADASCRFIDFMGLADACARAYQMPDQNFSRLDPFYAWNSALLTEIRDWQQLTVFPQRNGVLLPPTPVPSVPVAAATRCASLIAEVAPGMLTSSLIDGLIAPGPQSASMVDRMVALDTDPSDDLVPPIPVNQTDHREAYEIALSAMSSQLAGLTYTDLVGQAVGRYALVTPPDDEEMPPTLCIWFQDTPQGRLVRVRLIAWHEFESALATARARSLERMYYKTLDQSSSKVMSIEAASGRGTGGLDALPVALWPTDVEWEYTTCLFGHRQVRFTRTMGRYDDIVPSRRFVGRRSRSMMRTNDV